MPLLFSRPPARLQLSQKGEFYPGTQMQDKSEFTMFFFSGVMATQLASGLAALHLLML